MAEAGIAPSERATDAEFLRRAYLDAIGTLPTPAEVQAYLADPDPIGAVTVDQLLARNEYASSGG